ncbi:hypothetical protein EB093_03025 [bacterium]|nr:hypothetical protein [bacterium]
MSMILFRMVAVHQRITGDQKRAIEKGLEILGRDHSGINEFKFSKELWDSFDAMPVFGGGDKLQTFITALEEEYRHQDKSLPDIIKIAVAGRIASLKRCNAIDRYSSAFLYLEQSKLVLDRLGDRTVRMFELEVRTIQSRQLFKDLVSHPKVFTTARALYATYSGTERSELDQRDLVFCKTLDHLFKARAESGDYIPLPLELIETDVRGWLTSEQSLLRPGYKSSEYSLQLVNDQLPNWCFSKNRRGKTLANYYLLWELCRLEQLQNTAEASGVTEFALKALNLGSCFKYEGTYDSDIVLSASNVLTNHNPSVTPHKCEYIPLTLASDSVAGHMAPRVVSDHHNLTRRRHNRPVRSVTDSWPVSTVAGVRYPDSGYSGHVPLIRPRN